MNEIPKREPSGRRRRDPAVARGLEEQRLVLERRCAAMGWRPTEANLLKARSQDFGTPWGILHLFGKICEHEKLAAEAYNRLHIAYRQSIDAPRETPKNMVLEFLPDIIGGDVPEIIHDETAWAERVRAKMKDVDSHLRQAGSRPTIAVKRLCVDHIPPRHITDLKRGLARCVEAFGIEAVRQTEGVR